MRVLADTSAWVEFLRSTGSSANVLVRGALRDGNLVTTDPVIMEVLTGARTPAEEERLTALLGTAQRLPCERVDYVEAARIHRACRAGGETVRTLLDCLIAAVAIRVDVPVLCADRDFESIAHHAPLRLA